MIVPHHTHHIARESDGVVRCWGCGMRPTESYRYGIVEPCASRWRPLRAKTKHAPCEPAEIVRLYSSGLGPSDIARQTGMCRKKIVSIVRDAGVYRARARKAEKPARKPESVAADDIVRMCFRGMSPAEIAREVGASPRRVISIARGAGVYRSRADGGPKVRPRIYQ